MQNCFVHVVVEVPLPFAFAPWWDGRYMSGQGRVLVDGLVVEEECGVADGVHEVAV